jgi:O-antigen ligase
MLVHYGIPGLVAYLGIFVVILKKGWNAFARGAFREAPILAALWIGFIVWFLTGFVDSRLTTPEWQMQFVFLMALFFAHPTLNEQVDSAKMPSPML